jgi:L-gulonolactone oxidase
LSKAIPLVDDDRRRSWGGVVKAHHVVARPWFRDQILPAIESAVAANKTVLPFGLGRSYGDSNLNPDGALIDTTSIDRLIAFDPELGHLRAEAGISFDAILRFAVPRGWFVSTSPGTRFITLGGAIANDVHGKNHHWAGTFGCSIRQIGLARSDRGFTKLAAGENNELFAATVGGLGLTGLITWAEIQLVRIPSAFIDQEVIPFDTVGDFFSLAQESAASHEHTAAWIDCSATGETLGQGIFTRGNWAAEGGFRLHRTAPIARLPINAPRMTLNSLTLRAFNRLYRTYWMRKPRRSRVHYTSALHPLDAIHSWNRLYGSSGFYQYQFVIPPDSARPALEEILDIISKAGDGSFLSVLKTFGPKRSPGLLSFPVEGTTLALDFRNRGPKTLELLSRLDAVVASAGGRLYAAKDGRISAAMFQAGYPNWQRFKEFVDPAFSSSFWRRVSA